MTINSYVFLIDRLEQENCCLEKIITSVKIMGEKGNTYADEMVKFLEDMYFENIKQIQEFKEKF